MHVLFVCTGNICRSPTAERLAAAYATRFEVPDFVASSVGTRAVIGHPMEGTAARVLEALGGDAAHFAARQLNAKIASQADLVVAMTRAHRDKVLSLAPRLLKRTFTLAEAAHISAHPAAETIADLVLLRPQIATQELSDVPDPIGQDFAVFQAVGAQIAELLPPVIELVRRSTVAE